MPVSLAGVARDHAEAVLVLPVWVADAGAEAERIEKFERDE